MKNIILLLVALFILVGISAQAHAAGVDAMKLTKVWMSVLHEAQLEDEISDGHEHGFLQIEFLPRWAKSNVKRFVEYKNFPVPAYAVSGPLPKYKVKEVQSPIKKWVADLYTTDKKKALLLDLLSKNKVKEVYYLVAQGGMDSTGESLVIIDKENMIYTLTWTSAAP